MNAPALRHAAGLGAGLLVVLAPQLAAAEAPPRPAPPLAESAPPRAESAPATPAATPPAATPPAPAPAESAPATPAATPPAASPPAPAPPSAPTTPAASPPAPARPAPRAAPDPATAVVHLYVSRPGAWLELRDSVDQTPWRRACFAPCDARLRVDGMEARVAGPDLTTSNPFRIAPGRGTVRLAAAAGSPTARSIGTVGMIAGVPITLGGMGLYGYGRYEAQPAARTAGIVALAVGAITVLGSLPFLAAGSTTVRTADGKTIARRAAPPRF